MLNIVGLPVGNWGDMPPRNIEIIQNAKNKVLENDNDYQQMLSALNIKAPNCKIFYMSTNVLEKDEIEVKVANEVLGLLRNGEDVCIISDNGMPVLADPGFGLVQMAIENNIKISSTPGPSSITAAVIGAGCAQMFSFQSFLSNDKKQRIKYLKSIVNEKLPMVFMLRNAWLNFLEEIPEVLDELQENWGDRNGVLCYNLTTNRETFIRGKLSYLKEYHMTNRSESDQAMLVVDGQYPMLPMPKV